ncbi:MULTISPECIES: hypothetical protein [unclassified Sulfuricurvum]|uniref:hypothetical protein n=1 Tax=unclassified Sulfuricurvum TaxID=2632390 RepID=UPI0002999615|nr:MULTISPECIES: hypothetical protein [unclassified Sulfuricurvum]AFV96534.1 hypothetical protein B649_01100 [Candidatus Sulfuricurvum sp. RIFRC-1]HBM35992.1 hypothetical protein [Sulfuricurvum sp.]
MKKVLIGIVLIFGVLMTAKQLIHKDYTSAKQLADSGNYQAFYTEIKKDVAKGDKEATNLLMDDFLTAVQDGDTKKVKFYLEQDRSLINKTDRNGARAVDASLFGKVVRIDLLKYFLEYQPELNYQLPYYKNLSPLQTIALSNDIKNGSLITELLLDHGADVNYCSKKDDETSYPALLISYTYNNFEVFKTLLDHGALVNIGEYDLLENIVGTYGLEIEKYMFIKALLKTPLSSQTKAIIQSKTYRAIHENNMKYLSAILDAKSLNDLDQHGLLNLVRYYAATNEIDGMKLLVDHGLCTFSSICEDAMQKARLNNNTVIEKLIKENK